MKASQTGQRNNQDSFSTLFYVFYLNLLVSLGILPSPAYISRARAHHRSLSGRSSEWSPPRYHASRHGSPARFHHVKCWIWDCLGVPIILLSDIKDAKASCFVHVLKHHHQQYGLDVLLDRSKRTGFPLQRIHTILERMRFRSYHRSKFRNLVLSKTCLSVVVDLKMPQYWWWSRENLRSNSFYSHNFITESNI